MKKIKLIKLLSLCFVIAFGFIIGCTKPQNKEEQSKLEEARISAESAVKKLYELKQERKRLEAEAENKKGEEK